MINMLFFSGPKNLVPVKIRSSYFRRKKIVGTDDRTFCSQGSYAFFVILAELFCHENRTSVMSTK